MSSHFAFKYLRVHSVPHCSGTLYTLSENALLAGVTNILPSKYGMLYIHFRTFKGIYLQVYNFDSM